MLALTCSSSRKRLDNESANRNYRMDLGEYLV
jgi:hypothetical protein